MRASRNSVGEWQRQYIDNFWLGLGDISKITVANPFSNRTKDEIENPHIFVLNMMRKPDYFHFTCQHIFNKKVPPFQLAILKELWCRPFPMLVGSRGMGKSFLLALYAMLRALLCQGSKIVIVGAAFRQAKVVFDYCQEIWEHAPVLRDVVGEDKRNGPKRDVDRCTLRMGESLIVALPLGDGTKIRGQRANIIIADEFASIPPDIFETVVSGFASVSMSPIEKLQRESRVAAMKQLGMWTPAHEQLESKELLSNQTIVSGTAYYAFNHFFDYWRRYKAIIESQGDQGQLEEIFKGEIPDKFNWKDYSVIRIPVTRLPPGFMDQKHVAKAKATHHVGIYQMEYGAVFATDSNGFFKRSLIEACVVGNPGRPVLFDGQEIHFSAALRGTPGLRYIMGVDPASEQDNFSIVVLECRGSHRRIVYCWTTTRNRFKAKLKKGLVKEQDYYGYCVRKMRELLRVFPCELIALDTQGGGLAITEALQDPDKIREGERAIYPAIDPNEQKDTDGLAGDHIIELVNFAKADWVAQANHGMKKDLEDKALLFPEFDPASISLAIEEDKATGRVVADSEGNEKLYDTLEDCVLEIEDLKDELATIVHSQTGLAMRDRWDTPEIKMPGGKKGRLRKDRYSSLLMANMSARTLQRKPADPEYRPVGGFARQLMENKQKKDGAMWIGPSWYTENANSMKNYGAVASRGRHGV